MFAGLRAANAAERIEFDLETENDAALAIAAEDLREAVAEIDARWLFWSDNETFVPVLRRAAERLENSGFAFLRPRAADIFRAAAECASLCSVEERLALEGLSRTLDVGAEADVSAALEDAAFIAEKLDSDNPAVQTAVSVLTRYAGDPAGEETAEESVAYLRLALDNMDEGDERRRRTALLLLSQADYLKETKETLDAAEDAAFAVPADKALQQEAAETWSRSVERLTREDELSFAFWRVARAVARAEQAMPDGPFLKIARYQAEELQTKIARVDNYYDL